MLRKEGLDLLLVDTVIIAGRPMLQLLFLRETFGSLEASSNTQVGSTESNRLGFFGKAGLEYDINAYNSLQSTFSVRGFKSNTDGFTDGTFIGSTNNIIEDFRRTSVGGDLRSDMIGQRTTQRLLRKKNKNYHSHSDWMATSPILIEM